MAEPISNRREFLRGQAAARSARSAVDTALGDDALGDASHQAAGLAEMGPMLTLTRQAMACEFQVRLNASADLNQTDAAMAALDAIEAVEDRLTVYRLESQVMDLNRRAAAESVLVESELFELLSLCGQFHADTDGAFDITSGPLSRVWGFSRRAGRLPTEQQRLSALAQVGWRHVHLDEEAGAVRFLQAGMDLNFNCIGKGYALDQAAGVLAGHGVDDFLLHGGRSTLVARGSPALVNQADSPDRGPQQAGWGIGVRHPLRPQLRLAECWLADAAFSTSGSATQCFVLAGKRYGHLLDPRTGWPAEGLHSVSVIAPTGAEADALSTAFYVMGYDAAASYCQTRPVVQALFVLPGQQAGEISVRGVNLNGACWRLCERSKAEEK